MWTCEWKWQWTQSWQMPWASWWAGKTVFFIVMYQASKLSVTQGGLSASLQLWKCVSSLLVALVEAIERNVWNSWDPRVDLRVACGTQTALLLLSICETSGWHDTSFQLISWHLYATIDNIWNRNFKSILKQGIWKSICIQLCVNTGGKWTCILRYGGIQIRFPSAKQVYL